MMANPLRPSPSVLAAAIIVLIQAPAIFCWIPRLSTCRGIRTTGRNAKRQRVLLSASNTNDDNRILDDDSDDDSDQPGDHEPLFAEGDQLHDYISRLEAIMDSDFYIDDTDDNSQRLLEGGERVVLGDWMEWEETPCFGDSCGDDFDQCDIPEEYKVAAPKVDVMSFLGIRRAEPLQVNSLRDWD